MFSRVDNTELGAKENLKLVSYSLTFVNTVSFRASKSAQYVNVVLGHIILLQRHGSSSHFKTI